MSYRSLGNGINGAVECIDTLANILALTLGTSVTQTTVPAGSKARPTDVAGCTLEMGADGLWTGNLGTLTQAQADALVASGVMGNVKAGVRLDIGGTEATWNGTGVVASGNLSFTDATAATAWATANPSLVYDGLLATAGGATVVWRGGAWGFDSWHSLGHPGDLCVFGNSIIGYNGGLVAQGTNSFYYSNGFIAVACAKTGGVARIIENRGIGGQTSARMLSRIEEVLQTPAGTVVVMEVTNDSALGVSAASLIPNYKAIADAIIAQGKTCVMCTGIPRFTMSQAQKDFYSEINSWIKSYAAPGYIACDTHASIVDPATSLALSGTLADGVHPNATGATLMANPLKDILVSISPKRDIAKAAIASGGNRIVNPFFTGSGNSVPTSWNIQSAPQSWAYAPNPENPTVNCAVATIAPGGGMIINQSVNEPLLTKSTRIRAYVKIKISNNEPTPSARTQYVKCYALFYNGASINRYIHSLYWDTTVNTYENQLLSGILEFRTNSDFVPTDNQFTQLVIQVSGGCTAQLLSAYLGEDPE